MRVFKYARLGLSLVLLAIVLYFFWPLVGEIRGALELFRTARWELLTLPLLLQIISYAFLTWLNQLSLRPFPGRIAFGRLAALLTAMAFVETAIPSAGASGIALRARLLGKQGGYPLEASMFSLALETLYEAVAVAAVGLFGLAHLMNTGELSTAGAAWLLAFAAGLTGLMWAFWRWLKDPIRSRAALGVLTGRWNRYAGRWRPADLSVLEERLGSFHASLDRLKGVPPWKFLLAAFGKVFFDAATLGACFLIFQHPVSLGTLFTGYGLVLLLSGLAALPGGLGLADASVPVIFAGLGAPGAAALAAGLTYRLIAFWALRFIGFVSWQVLEARTGHRET